MIRRTVARPRPTPSLPAPSWRKRVKNLLVVLGLDADAVVPHVADRPLGVFAYPDLDPRVGLVAHVLGGVLEQVLEHLQEAGAVAEDHRQIGRDVDLDPALEEPALHQHLGIARQLL